MSDEEDGGVGEIIKKRRREEVMKDLDSMEEQFNQYEKYSEKETLNIPGPAGELLDLLKPNQVQMTQSSTPLTPTDFKEFDKKPWKEIIEGVENTISIEELYKAGYSKKISKKIPLIIQNVIRYETDAYVNFIDPTGEIEGTISKEVIALYPTILTPGSAILLQKYAVYIPSPITRHLIVTKHNIVKFVANEQLKTPLRWNWKITQKKVPIEVQTPTKQQEKKRKKKSSPEFTFKKSQSEKEEAIKQKEEEMKKKELEILQQEQEMNRLEEEERIRIQEKENELKKKEMELKIKQEELKRKKLLKEESSQKKKMEKRQQEEEEARKEELRKSQNKAQKQNEMIEESDEDIEEMLQHL
eukprot:gene10241-2661_t